MKRALPITVSVVALVAAGVLIGPSLMDWNKYKPQIIEQAKSAAGYDITIDGDIGLSILPMPQLKIEGLTVRAPRGKEANLLTMKRADVSVEIMPLISGDIQVNTVRLVSPDIKLEKLVDGSNSWMSDKLLADSGEPGVSESGASRTAAPKKDISLGKLVIEDGRVSYTDRQTGKVQLAESINLDLKAGTLASGPYEAGGSLNYGGKVIEVDIKTGKLGGAKKEIPADLKISLPEGGAYVAFDGIMASNPMQLQGKLEINADNLGSVLALGGGEPSAALSQKLAFAGLVTVDENKLIADDMKVKFGNADGKGNFSVTGLKEKAPVKVDGNIGLSGIVDLDKIAPAADKSKEKSVEEKVAKGEKLSRNKGYLPETLSLPFPIDANLKIAADGIQSGGKTYKGVTATITKVGPAINIAAKALDIPGKTQADINAKMSYATQSKSGDTGVIYADPSLNFAAVGTSEQLPTLLRAFAPDQGDNNALEIWKTGRFDLSGSVDGNAIVLRDSTIKLDQSTFALAGSYKPNGEGGRPDVMIDLTTDTVDIDYIKARMNGQNKAAVQKDAAAKTDMKKALEPVRSFNVPMNLTFDVSAQKAVLNAQQITGIRIKGKAAGQSLNLENASAQEYMGAVASLKGNVGNMADLSGVDLKFYGKTSDVKALMTAFEMDTSKLPASISGAEANITAKGKADELAFDAQIVALDGSLSAKGTATGILDKPAFSNITVGAKHPNLVKAIQIMNPKFSGGPGLEQPFTFETKAVNTGKVYDLSGMSATIGKAAFSGNLKVDTGAAKPSISGDLNGGNIPLDDLLGARNAAGGSGGGGGNAATSGGKWSKTTLETGWMHSVDLDLNLSAQSITYNGWNFINPKTKITLKDGNLNVADLNAGLFGGTANLDAKVIDPADPKQPLSLAVQSKMTNVNLEPLMFALSGSNRMKAAGDVSLDMDVKSSGLSPHALVSGLSGNANVNGKDVVMKGFDLAQIGLAFVDTGKPMDRLSGILTGATSGGETRFDTIVGAYPIQGGIVSISNMVMNGPAANIKSTGSANLPAWTIDTVHAITLKQAKEAGTFNVAIKGPLNAPANTFGKGLFNDLLTRRAQQKLEEKVQEKLPDLLGKDLGGKLQDLGILKGKTKAPVVAPAPTPAPAATPTPITPAPEPVAPTPEPEPVLAPAPQKSLQEQVEDDPAAAMQNILNSLGQ